MRILDIWSGMIFMTRYPDSYLASTVKYNVVELIEDYTIVLQSPEMKAYSAS